MVANRNCMVLLAFDKVWHQGLTKLKTYLLYKIENSFPTDLHHKVLFYTKLLNVEK
jgi:hypothetical protein